LAASVVASRPIARADDTVINSTHSLVFIVAVGGGDGGGGGLVLLLLTLMPVS